VVELLALVDGVNSFDTFEVDGVCVAVYVAAYYGEM